MDNGFFTVGKEQIPRSDVLFINGATPFSMFAQCKCVQDQSAIKKTVESLNRIGFPVKAIIAQVNRIRRLLALRTLVIAARKLHAGLMGPKHVALAWCVRFGGQISSRTVKRRGGLTAFQRAYQHKSHPRTTMVAW